MKVILISLAVLIASLLLVNNVKSSVLADPVYDCYGWLSNYTSSVCSGHGRCVATDTCICEGLYNGADCSYKVTSDSVQCNGVAWNSKTVCSGNGYCINSGTCDCRDGYSGGNCEKSKFTCFELNGSDPNVCAGHGACIGNDNCKCNAGWIGEKCNIAGYVCNGVQSNNASVCSGRGSCGLNSNSQPVCTCNSDYKGINCEIYSPVERCVSYASSLNFCKPFTKLLPSINNVVISPEKIIERDNAAKILYGSIIENKNPSDNCLNYVREFSCLNTIPICLGTTKDAYGCKSVCNYAEKVCGFDISTCSSLSDTGVCNPGDVPSEVPLTCFGVAGNSSSVCSGNGKCLSKDLCMCNADWTGAKCETPVCHGVKGTDSNVCGSKGTCVAPNICKCTDNTRWGGPQCNVPKCNSLTTVEGACNNKGECVEYNKCTCRGNYAGTNCEKCKPGWVGELCDVPTCGGIRKDEVYVCSAHGTCKGVDNCVCDEGYTGANCETEKPIVCGAFDSKNPKVCSGYGSCVRSTSGKAQCVCDEKHAGGFCEICSPLFTGVNCSTPFCDKTTTCNNHGSCDGTKCVCDDSFTGKYCDECVKGLVGAHCNITCDATTKCSGNGACSSTGTCNCYDDDMMGHFVGEKCDTCKTGYYGEFCLISVSKSFSFSTLGDRIQGDFVYEDFPGEIECEKLFDDKTLQTLSGATCIYTGSKLNIILSGSSTVKIGDSLVFSFVDPTGSKQEVSVLVSGDLSTLPKPFAAIRPSANVISGCDMLVLDASKSFSADRRKLSFAYECTSGPDVDEVNGMLTGVDDSMVFVDTTGLSSGTYTVKVTVTNFFGSSATAYTSFKVVTKAVPSIQFVDGDEQTAEVGDVVVFNPLVLLPSCYSGNGKFNYTWSQLSGNVVKLTDYGDGLISFVPTQATTYQFKLLVKTDEAEDVEASVHVVSTAANLVLVYYPYISGSANIPANADFELDLSLSFDPSQIQNEQEIFTNTACLNLNTASSCSPLQILNKKLKIPKNTLSAGVYRFTIKYSKEGRSTSGDFYINVVEATSNYLSVFMDVAQIGVDNIDVTAIDSEKPLLLYALLDNIEDLLQATVTWTPVIKNIKLNSNTVSGALNGPTLLLKSSALTPDQKYQIKATVTVGEKTGSSDITFTVNSPPKMGVFSSKPTTGVASVTNFALSCVQFYDVHTPLRYQFSYLDEEDNVWVPLSENGQVNNVNVVLPQGYKNNILKLKAVVTDSKGAAITATTTVTVTSPSVDDIFKNLNSTKTVTASQTLSTLDAISKIDTTKLSTEQVQQIKTQVSTQITNMFKSMEVQSSAKGDTKDTISQQMSVVGNINPKMVDPTVNQKAAEIVTSKLSNVATSTIVLGEDTIKIMSKSTADLLQTFSNDLAKRANTYSKKDVESLLSSLSNVQTAAARRLQVDQPGSISVQSGFSTFVRKLSPRTLNSLNETISDAFKYMLSKNFGENSALKALKSVEVSFKQVDIKYYTAIATAVKALKTVTNVIDFQVRNETGGAVKLGSGASATITTTLLSNKREVTATKYVCKSYDATTQAVATSSSCTVTVSGSTASITATQPGMYFVTSETVITSSPTPKKTVKVSSAQSVTTSVLVTFVISLLAMLLFE